MSVPSELKYTKDHEWAKKESDTIIIGITDYAQSELGDVVFVELPAVGDQVNKDDSFGTIEAVKAVADLFSPVSGEVVEINEGLGDQPDIVNSDPYGEGWMVKIKVADDSEWNSLMSSEDYTQHIG
ncbi:MAG: glycine cleavage system protein GcvH [Calditrichae bacterium]|nr:glycine cleavage system protein GcvH [Calditrichota bacterium]MCB9059000.1 glycine cleavage system protein GcvH [Calditrichia bacterium]